MLGSRVTLLLGSTGYALYIGSYLCVPPRSRSPSSLATAHRSFHGSAYKLHPNLGAFVIAAGGYLGVSAGLLWTAQGSLMLAYPTEDQKGMFIGIFWSIFNLGGVVGAAVSLGNNYDNTVRHLST